jgi:hypothetical protein
MFMIIPFKNLEIFRYVKERFSDLLHAKQTVGQSDTWILTELSNTSTMGLEKNILPKKIPANFVLNLLRGYKAAGIGNGKILFT